MYQPSYTKQFQKDLELSKKRGKSTTKIKEVISLIISGDKLPVKCKDHKLVGNYKNRRECHIEPDLLLIYKLLDTEVIFERIGTHSDLFK